MKKDDFKNLSREEMAQKKNAFKEELYKLNFQRKSSNVDKPHLFSRLKKNIARIQTILNQKGKVE